jgi:hypothetical protein
MSSTRPQPTTGTGQAPPAPPPAAGSSLRRGRRRRLASLGASGCLLAAGAVFTAATTAGLAPAAAGTAHSRAATGPAPAAAGTAYSWIATGWNIHLLDGAAPALARHFFDTPGSYGTSTLLTTDPILDGFAANPVLWFTSYKRFARELKSGAITYPYQWVYYDPENWRHTPLAERKDPRTYLRRFGRLAQAHGYHVIEAPALDLGKVAGSVCPRQQGETLAHWYVRCDIAGMAAPYSDLVVVQGQRYMRDLSTYDSLFSGAKQQALAANPSVSVLTVISTNKGTPAEMAAAARSVAANGYYVTIRSNVIQAAKKFFKRMRAAGY